MAFPPPALLLFDIASAEATSAQNPSIDTAHLLLAAAKICDLRLDDLLPRSVPAEVLALYQFDQSQLSVAFERAGVDAKAFRRRLRFELRQCGAKGWGDEEMPDDGVLHRTKRAKRVFERAFEMGAEDAPPLGVDILRAAASVPDPFWRRVWDELCDREPLESLFGDRALFGNEIQDSAPQAGEKEKPVRPVVSKTPFLDRFGRDLTRLAREGKLAPVWGRDKEIVRVAQILASARKGNALLVGAAGVGKTAVVEGLAARLAGDNLPPGLQNLRLVEVPLAGLLAGASYRGEWEERLQALLEEAALPGIILFLDEIHTLVGAGGKGVSDGAQIVKPALARGAVRVIGATTDADYSASIERAAALQRRFETVWIEEPTRETALEILRGARPKLEAHHGARFSEAALAAAVELSIRFLPDLRLPDKALDALDSAASAARMNTFSASPDKVGEVLIGRDEVAGAIARRARVPLEIALQNDASRLLGLESSLKKRVIGQDAAVARVADALKLSFSGFKAPGKPHGVFLFAGASGSGKTELAKALSSALYGDERALHRFDMSEYGERHTVSRLLGAPPGYVGHDEDGALSKALRERPASVVLFDEIEKAHPDVWNIWLQIFDEGHLTDARGSRLEFAETVVVLTSNLGSGVEKGRAFGFRAQEVQDRRSARQQFEDAVLGAVKAALKPELLGRIGEVLVFPPLDVEARHQLTELALRRIAERAGERGVVLSWKPEVVDFLARLGFDDKTGARPLQRAVDQKVALRLADALLRGDITSGECVEIAHRGDDLVFESK